MKMKMHWMKIRESSKKRQSQSLESLLNNIINEQILWSIRKHEDCIKEFENKLKDNDNSRGGSYLLSILSLRSVSLAILLPLKDTLGLTSKQMNKPQKKLHLSYHPVYC